MFLTLGAELEKFFEHQAIRHVLDAIRAWAQDNLFITYPLVQTLVLLGCISVAFALAPVLRRRVAAWGGSIHVLRLRELLLGLATHLLALALLWPAVLVARHAGLPFHIIKSGASLISAWVLIRTVSQLVRDPGWARSVAWFVWIVAALNILNLLQPTMAMLDSVGWTIGNVRISPLTVLKSTLAFALLLTVAVYASRLLESRISTSDTLSPSLKVLVTKALKIVLVVLAIVVAIKGAGIDLGALAIFSGAIGLGVGFGLQKIIGNLISGVILLLDKSIKPGDVIAVDDTYGWVNTLGGRYVSVITRDGVEHLIPNELLITERVENWTYSHDRTRLRIAVGVHYDSDVRLAARLCEEAAGQTTRVLQDPAPKSLVKGFGDNSVDLEIRFWIADAHNGVANVKSDVLLDVWDKFHEHGIEIPYPQRDLHLRSAGELVKVLREVQATS